MWAIIVFALLTDGTMMLEMSSQEVYPTRGKCEIAKANLDTTNLKKLKALPNVSGAAIKCVDILLHDDKLKRKAI